MIVVGWPVRCAVASSPWWLKVEPGDDLHARLGTRFDHSIGFCPVEAALARALDLPPLEERLLPAEADVGDQLEVAVSGGAMAPQEHAHAVVGTADVHRSRR